MLACAGRGANARTIAAEARSARRGRSDDFLILRGILWQNDSPPRFLAPLGRRNCSVRRRRLPSDPKQVRIGPLAKGQVGTEGSQKLHRNPPPKITTAIQVLTSRSWRVFDLRRVKCDVCSRFEETSLPVAHSIPVTILSIRRDNQYISRMGGTNQPSKDLDIHSERIYSI